MSHNSFAIPQVKAAFEHAYYVLTAAFSGRTGPRHEECLRKASLLSIIITVDPEIDEFRLVYMSLCKYFNSSFVWVNFCILMIVQVNAAYLY